MKPKPFASLNHFTVPVSTLNLLVRARCRREQISLVLSETYTELAEVFRKRPYRRKEDGRERPLCQPMNSRRSKGASARAVLWYLMKIVHAPSFRLVVEGTRVVVAGGVAVGAAGVISRVRPETHLKAYVVTCDDGAVIFASGHELAREDDLTRSPLGARRTD